jgi:hypothetical protein
MTHDMRAIMATRWADDRARIADLLDAMSALDDAELVLAATHLVDAQPAVASALWLAEALADRHVRPPVLREAANDSVWIDRIALDLVDTGVIGVTSYGYATRCVLSLASTIRTARPTVKVPNTVVARGLDDIEAFIEIGEPAESDVALVPYAAVTPSYLHTSKAASKLRARAPRSVDLVDPIRTLGAWGAARYLPPDWLTQIPIN